MNILQKTIVAVGAALAVACLLYPPFVSIREVKPSESFSVVRRVQQREFLIAMPLRAAEQAPYTGTIIVRREIVYGEVVASLLAIAAATGAGVVLSMRGVPLRAAGEDRTGLSVP